MEADAPVAARRRGEAVIAALYVAKGGVYYGLDDVDPWDEARDARLYAGPWPVVAHPPCARWGRYWSGGPSHHGQYKLGDDGGCFAAALASVRKWGGVLEHPEGSRAWRVFGIPLPWREGEWVACLDGGATCCVDQRHYGHRSNKRTWLYAVHVTRLPDLVWGDGPKPDGEPISKRRGCLERMSHKERLATPIVFRDVLLDMARSVRLP